MHPGIDIFVLISGSFSIVATVPLIYLASRSVRDARELKRVQLEVAGLMEEVHEIQWSSAASVPTAEEEEALVEVDHAADAILRLHQREAAVDVVQRELVRDEAVHVDVAGEVHVDELRNLIASFDTTERRACDAPSGDQEARDDVERLALARDAAHRRQPPAHPRRFHRLTHDA